MNRTGFHATLAPGKARMIGRCPLKGCRTVKARDVQLRTAEMGKMVSTVPDSSSLVDLCTAHGRPRPLRWTKIEGRFSEHMKCDPRCTAATGAQCDCSCSGANHGCDWL